MRGGRREGGREGEEGGREGDRGRERGREGEGRESDVIHVHVCMYLSEVLLPCLPHTTPNQTLDEVSLHWRREQGSGRLARGEAPHQRPQHVTLYDD